jgi:HEAT repeat protein
MIARRATVLVGFALALAATLPALSKSPTPVKIEDVVRVLRAHQDPTVADFRKVGSDVDSVLAEIVTSGKAGDELRVRAARALGRYPGQRAEAVLTTVLTSREVGLAIRAAAMTGLARVRKAAAVEDLRQYLSDPLPELRAGAAAALGEAGGEAARSLLSAAIESESSLDVRNAIEAALKRIP